MGRVTAPENIPWFLPLWAWLALVVWISLHNSSPAIVFVLFWFVAIASSVPFFRRRVGLLRFGIFVWLLPAVCAAIVTQILRTAFNLS